MKKTYMNPTLEVDALEINNSLLAGSLPKGPDEVTDEADVLGRDFDFEDEY